MRYLFQSIFQWTFQLIVRRASQLLAGLLISASVHLPVAAIVADAEVGQTSSESVVIIGSKNFGESYLLSEIAAQILERQGFSIERRFGLGGTLICYEALRNGEIAQLQNPKIEDKETRPPPRYNEGTLIEAMQNAWRFVDDEVLRDMVERLGAHVHSVSAPFHPESGAYGGGHSHGPEHGKGRGPVIHDFAED